MLEFGALNCTINKPRKDQAALEVLAFVRCVVFNTSSFLSKCLISQRLLRHRAVTSFCIRTRGTGIQCSVKQEQSSDALKPRSPTFMGCGGSRTWCFAVPVTTPPFLYLEEFL